MRKTIIIIGCCIVILLLGFTGYRSYQVWKQNHGMAMARAYLAKADVQSTLLALQQVLNANPQNIEACRMMASLTEAQPLPEALPEALVWRQRVLELNPKSFDDRLSLVRSAIIIKDYSLATNTLAGAAESDKNTVAYHNIAGSIAYIEGNSEVAEAHYREAVRLDPSNPITQVNLAAVRLHGTNILDMAEARIDLQRVILNSTNADLCSQARRELINDAMRFNDLSKAMMLSKDLAEQTNSVFENKLLRLDVLLKVKSAEFKPALALCQSEAANDNAKLFALANWQVNNLSSAQALAWLKSLPMEVQTNQPAALLAAECQVQLSEWHDLQAAIQSQNWGTLEFIRHALLARALREQDLTVAATAEWDAALKLANPPRNPQKGSLLSLYHLAEGWKWNSEAEEILWVVVNQFPEEQGAVVELTKDLITSGRTRPLMQLFVTLSSRSPNDLELKNNLAVTAMLLGAQELNPYGLAQEVYEKSPKNGTYASTYAFSLYLQGKYADALQVMQQLPPKDLEDPSNAGYYGLILKSNGDKIRAKAYLNWSAKATLLPEEKALFDKAKAGL
jgi:tetratricopeptide (TPR) repeat protein